VVGKVTEGVEKELVKEWKGMDWLAVLRWGEMTGEEFSGCTEVLKCFRRLGWSEGKEKRCWVEMWQFLCEEVGLRREQVALSWKGVNQLRLGVFEPEVYTKLLGALGKLKERGWAFKSEKTNRYVDGAQGGLGAGVDATKVYITDVPAYLLSQDVSRIASVAIGAREGTVRVGGVASNVGDFLAKTWWAQGEGVGVLVAGGQGMWGANEGVVRDDIPGIGWHKGGEGAGDRERTRTECTRTECTRTGNVLCKRSGWRDGGWKLTH
jgi:hypothetical protein